MKCFLSHSSKDKLGYVSLVADKLGPNAEYDERTFEEGMGNLEEIINALDRSQLFVLFISQHSLESVWVQREITEAKRLLEIGQLKRFFPLVIDRTVTYSDERIPNWIREAYNLRPITKPTVAAKRIRERMIEASWESHPMLKERDQIFVGRNDLVTKFERRIDDFSKDQPTVVFASGLNEIGRKSTLRFCLRKSNIVRDTYDPIHLSLDRDDGLEGLMLKLNDLGFSEGLDLSDLLNMAISEKVQLCAQLIAEISQHDEVILLEDRYCIVRFEREIAPWFQEIVETLENNKLTIVIACSARPAKYRYVRKNEFFFLEVPELEKSERIGLLRRYADHLGHGLSKEDFDNFVPLLSGFPEQVTYAASLIAEIGPEKAFKQANEIVSFSTFRAGIVISKYSPDSALMDFLRFISSFEFFSADFVYGISEKIEKPLTNFLDRLVGDNVCEPLGASGNYFRVNDVIRDTIIRDRYDIDDKYREALNNFVDDFLESSNSSEYDVSEYQIAVKEALTSKRSLPTSMLIPAHFLQAMRQLYFERNYNEVVALADRALQNKEFYDEHTEQDIRYYLCQCLARQSDQRFLEEVQYISGPEHDFLLGFYYRVRRRFEDALVRFEEAKKHQRTEQRARREIVFVLTTMEDYDSAITLARENFERYQRNPYLAQAYFDCLFHQHEEKDRKKLLSEIVEAIARMPGERASEMHDSLKARFEFEFGKRDTAFKLIDVAIREHSDTLYPLLTKLDLSIYQEDAELISATIKSLERSDLGAGHKTAISRGKAVLLALEGEVDKAIGMLNKDLRHLRVEAKERFARKLRAITPVNGQRTFLR